MARVANLHDNIDRTRNYVLQRENVLGRSPECNFVFDNKRVSRRHARIAKAPRADSYYVEDICTRGVFVNFHRIRGRHPLKEGDRICFLQFRNIHPLELERMSADDLKQCCDDPRNHGISAIVDLTFGYVELDEMAPQEEDKPKGLLERLKGIFASEKPKEVELPKAGPLPPKEPEPEREDQKEQKEKKKKGDWKTSRRGRYDLKL